MTSLSALLFKPKGSAVASNKLSLFKGDERSGGGYKK